MRHTQTKANPSGKCTQAHTHKHKQKSVSGGGQRGKRLVCRSCSSSVFSIHQPFQTFMRCHISHDRVTLWMSAGPRFCASLKWPCKRERQSMTVCVLSLTISHISGTFHHRSEAAHVFLPASCLCLTPMGFTQKL